MLDPWAGVGVPPAALLPCCPAALLPVRLVSILSSPQRLRSMMARAKEASLSCWARGGFPGAPFI